MLESRPPLITTELSPEEVAGRSFPTARRGADPDAVRRFLQEVAGQLGALRTREAELRSALAAAEAKAAAPDLDEATLTAALGQETTKVLRAAHDAARDVVSRAESRASELTAAAEAILAERTTGAEHEAERLIGAARARSEALLDEARAECRSMVEEAREARRRILHDLAARRREMHLQIEQIRAAKDALVEIVESAADSVEEIRNRLSGSEEAARQAAESAGPASLVDDVPIEVLVSEALGEPITAESPLVYDGAEASEGESNAEAEAPADIETLAESETVPAGGDEGDLGDDAFSAMPAGAAVVVVDARLPGTEAMAASAADEDAAGGDSGPEIVTGEPVAADEDIVGGTAAVPLGSEAAHLAVLTAVSPGSDEGAAAEVVSPEVGSTGEGEDGEGGHTSAVDALFARIRASRAADVAEARAVLDETAPEDEAPAPSPGDAAPSEQASGDVEMAAARDVGPEDGRAARRDGLVAAALVELERTVKRELRSDQNEMLSAARRLGPSDDLLELVPGDEAVARLAAVVRVPLATALAAGAAFAAEQVGDHPDETSDTVSAADSGPSELDGIAAALAAEAIGRIRERLAETLGVGDNSEEPTRLVGAAYREWKGERVARLAGDFVTQAFACGVLEESARRGLEVRWIVDERVQPCAECDDNALGEPQRPGELFPTGQQTPPIHAGCRCLLVPVPS